LQGKNGGAQQFGCCQMENGFLTAFRRIGRGFFAGLLFDRRRGLLLAAWLLSLLCEQRRRRQMAGQFNVRNGGIIFPLLLPASPLPMEVVS
jgi:hypothetical protein